MNDPSTEDYLRQVIKAGVFFSEKRLLVWDAFASHKSERTLAVQKELGIETAFIPGGCTKFIQAPDVSWNKPFKEKIRYFYTIWMSNGDRQEFTSAGNPKAPALEVVLEWVDRAWQELSKKVIIKSFKVCALTTSVDVSEDAKIACFKPYWQIGAKGPGILHKLREKELGRDGQDDEEAACFSDNENEISI